MKERLAKFVMLCIFAIYYTVFTKKNYNTVYVAITMANNVGF